MIDWAKHGYKDADHFWEHFEMLAAYMRALRKAKKKEAPAPAGLPNRKL